MFRTTIPRHRIVEGGVSTEFVSIDANSKIKANASAHSEKRVTLSTDTFSMLMERYCLTGTIPAIMEKKFLLAATEEIFVIVQRCNSNEE